MLLFYVLVFWPHGMWDLSTPTRDQTLTPCTGSQSLNGWTTREVPQHEVFFLCYYGNFQTFTVNKIARCTTPNYHQLSDNYPYLWCGFTSSTTPPHPQSDDVHNSFHRFLKIYLNFFFFLSTRSCLLRVSSVLKSTRTRTTRTPSAPLLTISSQEWKQVGISSILSGQRKWLPGYMLY